ncbi:MAG TPA: DUF763 domain-containing protein [Chitinivibrionales bacterium]|nr:DUF763 domain-containing protein [Chitinivibrionales bacterium]
MKRSGTADLPLHGGHVPEWLHSRMTQLGREIIRALVHECGAAEVLTRLSDPFWFQALGSVMGMDWHSSGVTTSVMGALKAGVNPLFNELGLYICGGRGKHSLKTPQELLEFSNRTGCNGVALVKASKLSAKVDNTCVLDGFSLYLHSFVVSKTGEWAVVQQGMNTKTKMARRYHWHSATVKSFVDDPHSAIVGENMGRIMNLSDSRAGKNRTGIVEFLSTHPDRQQRELRRLVMDPGHEVLPRHVDSKRLGAVLALAYEKQPREFVDALLLPGVGPRTVQSLALVSEVIWGGPSRFSDPARFAFAHGGKDGHPHPVPLMVYDESIAVLRSAIDRAKIDRSDKLRSIEALGRLARLIERRCDPFADVNKVIRYEREHSHEFGGMTVYGKAKRPEKSPAVQQLSLFDPATENLSRTS